MRRLFTAAAMLAALIAVAPAPAAAQQYPSKPIRLIVPFAAGTITDIIARMLAQPLSQARGQPIVVDNKAGGDGAVGALEAKRAAPDGHTLFLAPNSPLVVVPHLHKQPPYDGLVDFSPISFLGRTTFFIVVGPSVPAKTLPEFIAHAKANPGKLNYGTGNTTSIVSSALLAKQVGIDMLHVPYKSEPQAVTDLLSGQIHLMISSYATVAAHVQDGKLRPLVTILPQRSSLLPDVPSIVEHGMPKFPVGPWGAMVGPAGLPKAIVIERFSAGVASENALFSLPASTE